jgi:hypothetical protein
MIGRGLAAFVVVLALGAAPAVAASAPNLDPLLLTGAQVGPGYQLFQREGGRGLGVPTLDGCGLRYPSEKLRTARVQVVYGSRTSALVVSNEVVAYRPGGAAQALREATASIGRCPRGKVKAGKGTVVYRLTRLPAASVPPGGVGIAYSAVYTEAGKSERVEAVAVYVRNGDTLSGVYVYEGNAAGRAALAAAAAKASVGKLSQRVGGQIA